MKKILLVYFILIFGTDFLQSQNLDRQGKFSNEFIYLGIFVFFVVFGYFLWRKSQKVFEKQVISEIGMHVRNAESVKNFVEEESYNSKVNEKVKEPEEEVDRVYSVSNETAGVILKRLIKFEKDHKYLKKDITLTWLANHLNTNTKYLSETIKMHKGKNFNGYINSLRIQYITYKLQDNPSYRDTKIVTLAKECGYSSSQVFVIAFKKENGFPPSHFINNLNGSNM